MKTLEYSIILDESADELANLVNEALKDGWKLQGGLSVTVSANTQGTFFLFGQAMVKEAADYSPVITYKKLVDRPEASNTKY